MSVMVPKGTAAAVLAAIPLQMVLEGGEHIQNVIYAVVVISIVMTAFLLFLVEKTRVEKLLGLVFSGYRSDFETTEDILGPTSTMK